MQPKSNVAADVAPVVDRQFWAGGRRNQPWFETIDRGLAHATKGKVEGAYNCAQQFGRRRQLFDIWAKVLLGKQCDAA